jgi:hypothetical protein
MTSLLITPASMVSTIRGKDLWFGSHARQVETQRAVVLLQQRMPVNIYWDQNVHSSHKR